MVEINTYIKLPENHLQVKYPEISLARNIHFIGLAAGKDF